MKTIMNKHRIGFVCVMALVVMLLPGCAHHMPLPQERQQWAYQIQDTAGHPARAWAPVFVVYGHQHNHNRIGRPTAEFDQNGKERIYIDPEKPSLYVMESRFTTTKATYTNKIYRVHFPKVPFSLIPFNITAGKNVGILMVVTFNSDQRPVLVTTVGTCGCYMVVVPTQYLPKDAYPKDWRYDKPLNKYGERLPPVLESNSTQLPQIVVHLRPDVHRVMDLEILDASQLTSDRFYAIPMSVFPMEVLEELPLNGSHTSFFHQDGHRKGYVKGSVKPWETLFMSIISLDFFVGTDKAYADTAATENPFYTSLKPWRRQDSNMWNFSRFLSYWGWKL